MLPEAMATEPLAPIVASVEATSVSPALIAPTPAVEPALEIEMPPPVMERIVATAAKVPCESTAMELAPAESTPLVVTRTSPSSCARVTPSVRAVGLLRFTATPPALMLSAWAVAVFAPVAVTESDAVGAPMSEPVPTVASVTAALVVVANGLASLPAPSPPLVTAEAESAVLCRWPRRGCPGRR